MLFRRVAPQGLRAHLRQRFPARIAGFATGQETANTEVLEDYLPPSVFHDLLTKKHGVEFFAGVPDSLLKDYCGYVTDHVDPKKHLIAANEGGALAAAAGHYLGTGKIPLVYFQNSGLGNIVNPLLSLNSPKVYGLPALLLVGWRGEPGKKDEPQHNVQGKVMPSMLASMDLQCATLPDFEDGAAECLEDAFSYMKRNQAPFALMVKKQTFETYKMKPSEASPFTMSREDAYRALLPLLGEFDPIVSTTGFASREIYEIRDEGLKPGTGDHSRDFLTVGSMGHASAIALGLAIGKPSRYVVCLDGDGALAMHMGNALAVGLRKPKNFLHVVINNGVHDSVGAQPTGMLAMDLEQVALGVGYTHYARADTKEAIAAAFAACKANTTGPSMLEIRTKPGARKNLGRPKTTPVQNRNAYMDFLSN